LGLRYLLLQRVDAQAVVTLAPPRLRRLRLVRFEVRVKVKVNVRVKVRIKVRVRLWIG
tara:strand:- start:261 stop:434 length:174 start_codon:yes stop_codon:yes gene_type:complete